MNKKIIQILSLGLVIFFSGCQKNFQELEIEESQTKTTNSILRGEEKLGDSLRIGVVTDIHKCDFRSPGKITAERIQAFVDDVDNKKTDLNVNLGDNIRYRMEGCDNQAPEELVWTVSRLKTKAPLYYVLSDHDVDDYQSFEYWKKATNTPRTYYSFDINNFHIIVLDTVSGDGDLNLLCQPGSACEINKEAYHLRRDVLKNDNQLKKYLDQNKISKEVLLAERDYYENRFKAFRNQGAPLKEIEKRDQGSILEPQLNWLKEDLAQTEREKIIIFSDHPLLEYQGKRKKYQIVNQVKVQQILEESNKQIVAVNGETHEWGQEKIKNVEYFLIGKFSDSPIGEWAVLTWDEGGIRLEEIKI